MQQQQEENIDIYHSTIYSDIVFDLNNIEIEFYENLFYLKHTFQNNFKCIVKGCLQYTKSNCKICIFHHPIQKINDYKCFLEN